MIERLIRTLALAATLVVAVPILVSAPATTAYAAGSVSAKVGAPLKEAQDLAKQKRYKDALAKVAEAEAVPNKTAFENATIQKFKVYLYAQLRDYANAAKATEAALATGQLTAEETRSYKRQLALFYFAAGQSAKGVAAAKAYMAQYGSDNQLLLQLASEAYRSKDYATAADAAGKIVRAAESAGERPPEAALNILMGASFYLKRMDAYASALEKLVVYYGKPEYWRKALDSVETKSNYSQKNKFDLLRLKYTAKTFKAETDYVNLAEVALVQNLPAYAQAVLEAGYKAKIVTDGQSGRNKRLLTTAQQKAAAGKATLAADEQAAAAQATGDALAHMAEVYWSYGNYTKAVQLNKAALAKNAFTNISLDLIRLHLGVAQIMGRDIAGGQATMRQVKAKDGASDIARYWSLYARQM